MPEENTTSPTEVSTEESVRKTSKVQPICADCITASARSEIGICVVCEQRKRLFAVELRES